MRPNFILLAIISLGAIAGCVKSPPLTEKVVVHDAQKFQLAYREEWPVFRVRVSGVGHQLNGGQLDLVRDVIAQHVDPEICPPGEGLDIVVGRKVTPILLPQVDYHPNGHMFQIFASCGQLKPAG